MSRLANQPSRKLWRISKTKSRIIGNGNSRLNSLRFLKSTAYRLRSVICGCKGGNRSMVSDLCRPPWASGYVMMAQTTTSRSWLFPCGPPGLVFLLLQVVNFEGLAYMEFSCRPS